MGLVHQRWRGGSPQFDALLSAEDLNPWRGQLQLRYTVSWDATKKPMTYQTVNSQLEATLHSPYHVAVVAPLDSLLER